MGTTSTNNSRIRIAELLEKNGVEDGNLMIVEDDEDTKRTTVNEFKKNLTGDAYDPSDNKFYSSKRAAEMHQDLKRDIYTKADQKDVDTLKKQVASLTASEGTGKDTELVAARNGKASLSERLSFDREISDTKYMEKIKRTMIGKTVDIRDHYGYVDISIVDSTTKDTAKAAGTLIVSSRNLLDYTKATKVSEQITVENDIYGVKYVQKDNGATTVSIPLPIIYAAGKYVFYASISFSDSFKDKNIKFNIGHSDGSAEQLPYMHQESFAFEAKKGFNKLSFTYDALNIVNGASVSFANIMLIPASYAPKKYIPYEKASYSMNIGDNKLEFFNNNYIYESNIQNGDIYITYYDNDISTEWLYDQVTDLREIIENKIDKCGMITGYGTYQFLDNMYINTYEDGVIIEDSSEEFYRNGVPSKKITIDEDAEKNSTMRIPLDNHINVIETFGVMFYIDKTLSSYFDAQTGGLKIRLVSDNITIATETNYYEYLVKKDEMVQGWNFVKKRITEFISVGNPNPNGIQYIYFEICRNSQMNRGSIYLNSFVFNQKMKPTVLLCLNGTYDESIDYLYPYMKTRGMRPTIFLNAKRTLTAAAVDKILKYKIVDGWDIGTDGCHPNKEILVEDDNYRNQYIALRSSWNWLRENMVNSPISYSAPYGNLRPITVPILRDLGYKISKVETGGYCGFFAEKDMAIPSHLISNLVEIDSITDMIDHAIESNQAVCLYTNDVTEYGSEIDAKKVIFESVIDYIKERVDEGSLVCMTFSEFYHKCVD